jgi:hypothetical protein
MEDLYQAKACLVHMLCTQDRKKSLCTAIVPHTLVKTALAYPRHQGSLGGHPQQNTRTFSSLIIGFYITIILWAVDI